MWKVGGGNEVGLAIVILALCHNGKASGEESETSTAVLSFTLYSAILDALQRT
uniref:Uncharacterized protein n=1 Tax=Arundo donax TaxID=35708 RepID=A0A0A8ZJI3_ARUDO